MNRLLQIILLLLPAAAPAQNAEMADTMRSQGKIYVVIGVIAVIFICLLAFLVYLERRLTRVEKEIGKKETEHSRL